VSDKHNRHPVKNFFVKKSFQFKLIAKTIVIVVATGLLTLGLMAFIYNSKARTGSFYYMSDDLTKDLELQNIFGIILPPIIAVELMAIFIAFGIGLFSSRKIAVPLYKVERWATSLRNGKLNTTLAFREVDHLKELTSQCNAATDFYRDLLTEITTCTETIAKNPTDANIIDRNIDTIRQLLRKVEL